ncbi:hypothetical protein [Streptomyces sp. NBC_01373]|uniref:hypothetical protein n=1 Tax=Streptomyces sp. NBC_01373 TaxID=2903843 RepID=UPI002255A698|nr:hypothetical protein [Streptomyces sp. NBC_01373]MCX4700634.1 hypothetical protein [Streptomyces sp. NBC_01373]
MRGLPARRIASSAVCATFLLGLAAPAAVAIEREPAGESVQAAPRAPVPGADALLAQVKGLADLGGVLTPVTDLLNTVLKADDGQLTAEEATKLGDAVKDAIAKVTAAAPAALAAPAAPAAPETLPDTTAPTTTTPGTTTPGTTTPGTTTPGTTTPTSTLPTLPTLTKSGDSQAPAVELLPADLVADALAGLQKAVDTLLKAVTSGDAAQVEPAVTGVLTGLVNVVSATLLSGKLPAPTLPGLPTSGVLPAS